jgi:UDP-glucose 4-epimerase
MLNHKNINPDKPDRVVILGAAGFVGHAATNKFKLEATNVLPLGRTDINLLDVNAKIKLEKLLKPSDTLVIASAEAPCKNAEMLIRNIQMITTVCEVITKTQPAQVIYISSDAVYADSNKPLKECSSAEPGSLHGIMHLTREIMLKEVVKENLAILRPTLIHGKGDPHNGYGPNQFRRLAKAKEDIVLFGNGEELRDHIHIDDVAELIRLMAWHNSDGILNAATGKVTSFKEIAEMIKKIYKQLINIQPSPRIGSMPHNGYRAFNPKLTYDAFPNFQYSLLEDSIIKIFQSKKSR